MKWLQGMQAAREPHLLESVDLSQPQHEKGLLVLREKLKL